MITKEEKELIEAKSHEKGIAMTPIEELALLGFYDNLSNDISREESRNSALTYNECKTTYNTNRKDWNRKEEYEFDNEDEYYRQLDEVLKRNNDRQKYFA